MITLHYNADHKALIDSAWTDGDRAAIEANYPAYVEYLRGRGFEIDVDSDQTTLCWSGADKWPSNVQDFWAWLNT